MATETEVIRKKKKPRKWESFKGTLPKFEGGEPDYITKVNKLKEDLLEQFTKTVDFADFIGKNIRRKEELEEELKEINLNIEAAQQILVDRFENDGMQSLRLSTGELFYLHEEPYSKVEDKALVNNWFEENNMGEMRTVNWQSLNAIVKERLEHSQPVPEGVSVFMKTVVKMRKG